ncbi:MAG: hypothetical protein APF78_09335 [Sphingomonadales bacterium BRH_c3]|nr:MAG: hypothetical protein APF78_09335 [Sphingomonadales bacterium BRH_c3]
MLVYLMEARRDWNRYPELLVVIDAEGSSGQVGEQSLYLGLADGFTLYIVKTLCVGTSGRNRVAPIQSRPMASRRL